MTHRDLNGDTFLIGQSNCTVHYILPENNLYPPTNYREGAVSKPLNGMVVSLHRRGPGLLRSPLSWADAHNARLVNSSGCKIVNMALIFLYKLYKNGKRMVPEPLLAAGGGALARSLSASGSIATKLARYSGGKRRVSRGCLQLVSDPTFHTST